MLFDPSIYVEPSELQPHKSIYLPLNDTPSNCFRGMLLYIQYTFSTKQRLATSQTNLLLRNTSKSTIVKNFSTGQSPGHNLQQIHGLHYLLFKVTPKCREKNIYHKISDRKIQIPYFTFVYAQATVGRLKELTRHVHISQMYHENMDLPEELSSSKRHEF